MMMQMVVTSDSHGGPIHHNSDVTSCDGKHPLKAMSAGLDLVDTCLHRALSPSENVNMHAPICAITLTTVVVVQ